MAGRNGKGNGSESNGQVISGLPAFNLDPLEDAFVYAYLISFNATKAYKTVSPNVTHDSAMQLGYRMLQRPQVKDAIDTLRKVQLERFRISADKVLQEIAILAFQNAADYGEWDDQGNLVVEASTELPYHLKACIKSIEKDTRRYVDGNGDSIEEHKLKLTFHSKEKALEMLGRNLNLFRDNASAPVIVNFNIQNFDRPKPVQYIEVEAE